jgi:8-oxo-dGTP pyrophosphatase MutT (NUDIX family)
VQADPVVFGSPTPGFSNVDRPAAYAVIINGEGVVAVVKSPKGYFLPGGGSLPGETPEETVLREVREEVGRSARIVGRLGDAIQYYTAEGIEFKMHAIFFLAEFIDEPLGHGEHELHWLSIAEIDGAFFHECHEWVIDQAIDV